MRGRGRAMRPPAKGAAVLLLVAGAVLPACTGAKAPEVVLVGIDGADWSLIDPLIEEGRLPAFERLRKEGLTGVLVTDYASASPAIWNSIVTGKHPRKHGIRRFLVRSPRSYYEIPVTSYDRKAAALWNILSHHGRRVSAVAWWASWPAEPVDGAIVSQRFFLSRFGVGPIGGEAGIGVGGVNPQASAEESRLTWPEDLAARLERRISAGARDQAAGSPVGRLIEDLAGTGPGPALAHDLRVVDNIVRTDVFVSEATRALRDEEGPFDFMAVYFEAVDVASHLFWKFSFPEEWKNPSGGLPPLPDGHERYAPIIPATYELVDGLLGRVLDGLAPETLLIVASDHGFHGYRNPYDYNYPANRLLEAVGLLSRGADGAVDYSRTRWFDHSGNPWESGRRIFLNLEGRYPLGTVAEEEAAVALADLKKRLEGLRTVSGQKVVLRVGAIPEEAGALVRINNRLRRDDRILAGMRSIPVSEIFPPRTLSGNHRPEGIVAFLGAGIGPGKLDPISSLDITPTILASLGLPLAADMDGTPCLPVVERRGGSTAGEPVASYDFLLAPAETREGGSAVDESLKERLRALGYIR